MFYVPVQVVLPPLLRYYLCIHATLNLKPFYLNSKPHDIGNYLNQP